MLLQSFGDVSWADDGGGELCAEWVGPLRHARECVGVVQDWLGVYPGGSVTDPQGAASGSDRVFRGGGWGSYAWGCRSAGRRRYDPGGGDVDGGFRSVLAPGQ